MEMSEKEIIDLCQKGNLEYFSELYEKYVEMIYKFIFLKTTDKELSEDLTSQTFFKALEKIQSFKIDDSANFRAWLYRIAYNLIIDTYKSKKQDLSFEESWDIGYEWNFWDDIDQKETLKKVRAYFDTLNPKHKEIILMRIWDDLSFKEIAEITWESLSNCKKIVSRTLQNIPKEYYAIFILLIFF